MRFACRSLALCRNTSQRAVFMPPFLPARIAFAKERLEGVLQLIFGDVHGDGIAAGAGGATDGFEVGIAIVPLRHVIEVGGVAGRDEEAVRALQGTRPVLEEWETGACDQEHADGARDRRVRQSREEVGGKRRAHV